ncbi:MAG: hypothetical protein R3D03_21195 [Geminicoccaceae bacterium]|nr:hypothetical protein [Geminicoccaceae bacterium]
MKTLITSMALALLLAGAARAEISKARPSPAPLQPVAGDQPLRVQCWQHGVLVLEQHGLEGLNMGPLLQESTLQLRRRGERPTSLFIAQLGDSLCMVTSLP